MTKFRIIFAALISAVALVLFTGVASAQEVDTYDDTPPSVLDDSDENPVADDDVSPQAAPQVLDQPTTLPVTGGDLVGLATIGAGALLVGSGFVIYRRRHA